MNERLTRAQLHYPCWTVTHNPEHPRVLRTLSQPFFVCLEKDFADSNSSHFVHIRISRVSRVLDSHLGRQYLHDLALYGAKYLEALCDKNLVKLTPSKTLNQMYAAGLVHDTREKSRNTALPTEQQSQKVSELVYSQKDGNEEEIMLLKRWNGKLLAEKFVLPAMELEIERAVEQVEKSLKLIEESAELKRRAENAITNKPPADRKNR